jgi:hypothetical protein
MNLSIQEINMEVEDLDSTINHFNWTAEEMFEAAKDRQCWKCRVMLGVLCLCPHCGATN